MKATIPVSPLSRGLNDSRNPTLLQGGEAADILNLELNGESLQSAGGQLKLNNQRAPRSGIRTRVDPGQNPLRIAAGQSVPVRGYGFIPYSEDSDIGGQYVDASTIPTFGEQRGEAFDLRISFQVPPEERLFRKDKLGECAPSDTTVSSLGFDEALMESFQIVQKGGDRTSPMSWALGVVNLGDQYADITGQSNSKRVSNYALVFMWLDAPRWGRYDPNELPYWVGDGTNATIETQAAADNTYGTMAYRAVVFDVFVEPGVTYHTSLQLQRDTGSTSYSSGTGFTTATWNGDGILRLTVKDSLGNTFEKGYDEDGGSLSGAYVMLGPTDSLKYLCRYGVRWHGRDAMYLGLGMRFAPWNDAGFIPFGQDSAPLEYGGFRMTDLSCKDPLDLWPGNAVMPTWRVDTSGTFSCNHNAGLVATATGAGGSGGGGRGSSNLGGNLLVLEGNATAQAYRDNLFKGARPWIENDGSVSSFAQGGPTLYYDALGYPLEVTLNVDRALTYMFRTEKTLEGSWYRSGTYVIEYDGTGKIGAALDGAPVTPTANASPYDHAGAQTLNGSASRTGRVHFSVTTPSSAGVAVMILESDVADPIRNMRCYHIDDEATLYAGGSKWDPTLVSDWGVYDSIRFMDVGHINNSTVTALDLALTSEHFTWQDSSRGFPISAAVDLCNTVEANCHYCIPHLVTESQAIIDYLIGYAKANLDNDFKFKPEVSNEVWNGGFEQGTYFEVIGFGLGSTTLSGSAKAFQERARAYSQRVAEMVARLDVIYGVNEVATRAIKMAGGWIIAPSTSWNEYVLSWQNLGFSINTIEVAPYTPASPQGVQFCATTPSDPNDNNFVYDEDTNTPKLCVVQLTEDDCRAQLEVELSVLVSRLALNAAHAGGYGVTLGAYECGIQTAPDFNFNVNPNNGATTTADEETFFGPAITLQNTLHESAWMQGFLYRLLIECAQWVKGTISIFTTHGVGNRFGYYGIQRYPGDTASKKYLALQDYQTPATGREQITGRQGAYPNPWGPNTGNGGAQPWAGLGGELSGNHNPDALRGYTVAWVKGTAAIQGMRARIDRLTGTSGSPAYANFSTLDTFSGAALSAEGPGVVFPFRWSQRDLVLSDFRIYSGPVDLSDARASQQLLDGYDPDDSLDPGQSSLLACWPLDDAEGGVLREVISGRDGYLAPMTLAQDERGSRGGRRLFLSGEGEALALDLSEHSVAQRALEQMLAGDSQGFAVEVTCEIPEASYALGTDNITETDTEHPRLVPNLISWDFKDPEGTGLSGAALPLLQMGPRSARAIGAGAFNTLDVPIGFGVLFANQSDQEGTSLSLAVPHANTQESPTYKFSREARWVGQTVTLQVGVQATANADEYQVYLAMYPAELFLETDGSERAEVAYFTTATIGRKDVARSVITIGGEHDVRGLGYLESNMRVILDEVRVFAANAPGKLPATSGGESPQGEGKILSTAIPPRELEAAELMEPLGPGVRTAGVTEGSSLVEAPGGSAFSTKAPSDAEGGPTGAYLAIAGDDFEELEEETFGETRPEFYHVQSVNTTGSQLSLASSYSDSTRRNASASVIRMFGYTSFEVDLTRRPLTLGGGAGFDPATTKGTDALFEALVPNRSPIQEDFSIRVFNPIGAGSIGFVQPTWVRGLKSPRHNPILGLHGTANKLLAASRGSLFEADDRWRTDGPLPSLRRSLAFFGKRGADGVMYPEADDRVEITGNVRASLDSVNWSGNKRTFKVRYKPFSLENESVLLWFGTAASDASEAPASLTGNSGQYMLRVRSGVVEFVIFSDSDINGTSAGPDRGVYVARSRGRLKVNDWNTIVVELSQSGTPVFVDIPRIFVNGRSRSVSVNEKAWDGVNAPSATQWLPQPSAPSGASVIIGCAHDAVIKPAVGEPFVRGAVNGPELVPNSVQGYIHSANGLIGPGLAISDLNGTVSDHDPSADPSFGNPIIRLDLNEGAGHITEVAGSAATLEPSNRLFATIRSHPLLSRFHALGRRDQAVSFATYGSRTFCANGGRPVVERDGVANFAGLQQPSFAPDFEIEKRPLWVSNVPGDDATLNGPLIVGNHYSSYGNNYLRQPGDSELDWESGDTWALKMRVRLRSTNGTIQLWGQRISASSGRALEVVNGRVRITWYDSSLKKQVWIETNKPVIEPGVVYYLYMRKAFPTGGDSGNWSNSFVTGSQSGVSNDMLVVRRFMQEDADANLLNYPTFAAITDDSTHAAVSFTTQDADTVADSPVTGQVTENMTLDRAAGLLTATAGEFHPDMLYKYVWLTDDTSLYRISEYISTTQVSLVNASDGSTPTGNVSGVVGGVYTGVSMVKSESFDASTNPDKGSYDVEVLGSALQANPINGINECSGEVWDFGYYIGSGEDFFEAAQAVKAETGADTFADTIYSGNAVGPLLFDVGGNTFTSVASTDPNTDLEVSPITATSSVNASSLTWNQVQQINLFSGARRVRVTFYDPKRDIESNPSPELFVFASAEDGDNPSGEASLLISQLPISPDGEGIYRRVYMSLAGTSQLFRVAEIPDNTSTSVAVGETDVQIASGALLAFNNSAPPRCSVVAVSQRTVVYGALDGDPDAFVFSVPFRPESAPLSNVEVFDTGDSQRITGMADLNGNLVVFKENAMSRYLLLEGNARGKTITRGGAGCVGPAAMAALDDRLYFMSQRGPFVYTGSALPVYLGERMEGFTSGLQSDKLSLMQAGINRSRNQVVFTAWREGQTAPDRRFSLEFDHAYSGTGSGEDLPAMHRISLYEGLRHSALGEVDESEGGSQRFVGGTTEGFVVWMDRSDTRIQGLLNDPVPWGLSAGTLSASSSSSLAFVSQNNANLDQRLEGARGLPVRWNDGGTDYAGWVSFVDGGTLYLEVAGTAPTGTVSLGAARLLWRSRHFEADAPYAEKRWHHFSMTRRPTSGQMLWQIFMDFETGVTADSGDFDLNKHQYDQELDSAEGTHLQLELASDVEVPNLDFELFDLAFVVNKADAQTD